MISTKSIQPTRVQGEKLSQVDMVSRLRSAYPAALSDDVDQMLTIVSAGDAAPSEGEVGPIRFDGDLLHIPSRVYFPEPSEPDRQRLNETQQLLLSCLYTRHCDGFVRQRHLESLLSSSHPWVAPFIFALVGEYVVEIIQLIEQQATALAKAHLSRFATDNPEFAALTRKRVVSYWAYYYRRRFSRFSDYPGYRLLKSLDLWPPKEARLLQAG
jgi:hypothetical protein